MLDTLGLRDGESLLADDNERFGIDREDIRER